MLATLIIIIHVIVSIVLVVAVLFQSGKGADLGAAFGGASSQTLFGSAGPATFLTKITAVCAGVFMVTSLFLTWNSIKAKTSSIMTDMPAVTQPAAQPEAGQTAPQGAAPEPQPAGK